MKEREALTVGGLVALMLILWLGFVVHRSPDFAGSFWGGVLAVSGTLLMLVPLAYVAVKRIKPLKKSVTARVPMRTLLAWHIYAGVLGPILVVLHTGHKFESLLGIALTAMTLVVVVSGFIGRHLMNRIGHEIRDKRAMLAQLNAAYDQTVDDLRRHPGRAADLRALAGLVSRIGGRLLVSAQPMAERSALPLDMRAIQLADAIADVEYAVRTHETFKSAFARWLKLHIALSAILYVLLAFHVWAAIHFGLRWFS